MSKLCPSAQPGMDNCRVLGVVQQGGATPRLEYLNQPVPATAEILALAAPLKPTEIYRLSATCAEHKCPHFDGADCRLATRIVKILPAVVDAPPPCTIRKDCRWYSQEGGAACKRCPRSRRSVTISRNKLGKSQACQSCSSSGSVFGISNSHPRRRHPESRALLHARSLTTPEKRLRSG